MSAYEMQERIAAVMLAGSRRIKEDEAMGDDNPFYIGRMDGAAHIMDMIGVAFPDVEKWVAELMAKTEKERDEIKRRLGERAYFASGGCEGPGTIYRVRESGYLLEKMISCPYCDGLMPAGRTHCGRQECFEMAPKPESEDGDPIVPTEINTKEEVLP